MTEYAQRISRAVKFELVELPESKNSGDRAKADEAEAIFKKLTDKDTLVALDERGQALSSVAFAAWVQKAQASARDVAFVIGGDDGLDERVRARAALTLSLSAMTLPHRLARLVFLEQLYRAFSIIRKEPYHR